jgi:hypothetical protein
MSKRKAEKDINCHWEWAMPHKNTFIIKPIKELIELYVPTDAKQKGLVWIDPFANESIYKNRMTFTNDLNEEFDTTHHMDALAFLRSLETASVDGVLFDPPYTIHQINEVYKGYGDLKPVKQATAYYSEIDRVCKEHATVISFGYTGGGVPANLSRDSELIKLDKGKKRATKFEKKEVLVIAHGGGHQATLVVVDRR